jgi:hypothetical protein
MFFIEYSLEVMQLAFGLGFLVLVFFVVRPLIRIHRLLAKVDYLADKMGDLAELFDEYIRKPAQVMSQVLKFASPFLFRRRKK